MRFSAIEMSEKANREQLSVIAYELPKGRNLTRSRALGRIIPIRA